MAVATPLIAILQGSFLLSDYRINYKDAPRPITPCHGALCHGDQQIQSTERGRTLLTTADNPLRLLVVGDSLAAGVGVSDNGLPVLPESIAKALSKALDGRVVCWTCVGTPGTQCFPLSTLLLFQNSHKSHRDLSFADCAGYKFNSDA